MTRIKQTNKRVELSMQQKLEIIEKFNNGSDVKQLSAEYAVTLQTVDVILKIGNELMSCGTSEGSSDGKRKQRKYAPDISRKSSRGRRRGGRKKSVISVARFCAPDKGEASDDSFTEPQWLNEYQQRQSDDHGKETSKSDGGNQVESEETGEGGKESKIALRGRMKQVETWEYDSDDIPIESIRVQMKCEPNILRKSAKVRRRGRPRKNRGIQISDVRSCAVEEEDESNENFDEPQWLKDYKKDQSEKCHQPDITKQDSIDTALQEKNALSEEIAENEREDGASASTSKTRLEDKVSRAGRRLSKKSSIFADYETDFGTDGSDKEFQPSSEDEEEEEIVITQQTPKILNTCNRRGTRVRLSIDKKLELLDKLENGATVAELSEEYGAAPNTIRDMVIRKDEYRSFASMRDVSGIKQLSGKKGSSPKKSPSDSEKNEGIYEHKSIDNDSGVKQFPRFIKKELKSPKETDPNKGAEANTSKTRATRVVLSIDKKIELLDKLESGVSIPDLSAEFGVAVNTIRDMVIRKEEYRRFASSVKNVSGIKQMILPVHDQLTKAMLKWYNEQTLKGKSVYYQDLDTQSKHIIFDLRLQKKERITQSWFDKFLTTFKIAKDGHEVVISKEEQQAVEERRLKRLQFEAKETPKRHKIKKEASPSKPKRKRVELNIQGKLKIIEEFENGSTPIQLAQKYGIGQQTVKDIVRTSDEYKEFAARPDFNSSLKRVFYKTTRRLEGKERMAKSQVKLKRNSESPSTSYETNEHNYSTIQDETFNDSDDQSLENTTDRLKRKRVVLSIEKRLEVIARMEKGEDPVNIANEHNVSQQTIRDIYTRKAELKKFASGLPKNLVKTKGFMSKPLYSELDEPMLDWYKKELSEEKSVTPTEIALKARSLFGELNMKGIFRAGRWFKLFVKRHNIQKMNIEKEMMENDIFQDSGDSQSDSEEDPGNGNAGSEDEHVTRKKRRRVVLDIDQKLELLDQIENGELTINQVSSQYGVACGTIRDWLARRGVMQTFAPPSTSKSVLKSRMTYVDLNNEIYKWYQQQPEDEKITDKDLAMQARRIFNDLKMGGNFIASRKWLERFKEVYINNRNEYSNFGQGEPESNEEGKETEMKCKSIKQCLEDLSEEQTDSEAQNNSVNEPCANIHISYIDDNGDEILEDIPVILEAKQEETEKAKRKRVRLTIEQKLELIKRLENGESVTEIAYDYGVAFTTVREIAQKKEELVEFENCPLMKDRKSAKKNAFCDLDKALITWYKKHEDDGVVLTSEMCIEKAKNLSGYYGLEGRFRPTLGWFVRFQQRHNIGQFTDDGKELVPSWFTILDEAMLAWFKEQQALGGDLSEPTCSKQASEFFVTLDLRGLFIPTSEWFESFLQRHELTRQKNVTSAHNESATTAVETNITVGMESFDSSFVAGEGNPTEPIQYLLNSEGEQVTDISLPSLPSEGVNTVRKRNLLSVAKKLELIEQIENGVKVRQVALDYNIGQQTVRDIIMKKDELVALKNGYLPEKSPRKKRKDAGISKKCVQIQYINAEGEQVCADIPLSMPQKQKTGEKRKRVVLSIEKKMQIIRLVEAGAKIKEVALEHGIGSQTVRDILMKKDKFSQFSPFTNRKTLRGSNFVALENAMLAWYNEQEALGLDVSTSAGLRQADYLANNMCLTTFTPTKCWYSRFKHRFGLGGWKNEAEVSAHRDNLMGHVEPETYEFPTEVPQLEPAPVQSEMILNAKDGQLLQLTQDDLLHIGNESLVFAESDINYGDEAEHYDEVFAGKVDVEEINIVFEKDNIDIKTENPKNRRVRLTIDDKLHVIGMSDNGYDVEAIAIEKGVSKQQVKDIINSREELLAYSLNHTTNRYSMKKSNYEKMDAVMLGWYNQRLAMGLPMSNAICTNQAKEFFESMSLEGPFKMTRWLPRLKQLCEQQEQPEESMPELDLAEPEEQKVILTELKPVPVILEMDSVEPEANISSGEPEVSHGKIASYLDTILHYIENQQDVRISDKRMLKRLFNKTRRKGIAANNSPQS